MKRKEKEMEEEGERERESDPHEQIPITLLFLLPFTILTTHTTPNTPTARTTLTRSVEKALRARTIFGKGVLTGMRVSTAGKLVGGGSGEGIGIGAISVMRFIGVGWLSSNY